MASLQARVRLEVLAKELSRVRPGLDFRAPFETNYTGKKLPDKAKYDHAYLLVGVMYKWRFAE